MIRLAFRFFSVSAIFNATPMYARLMQKRRGQSNSTIRGPIQVSLYPWRMVAGHTQIPLSTVLFRDRPCAGKGKSWWEVHNAYVSGDCFWLAAWLGSNTVCVSKYKYPFRGRVLLLVVYVGYWLFWSWEYSNVLYDDISIYGNSNLIYQNVMLCNLGLSTSKCRDVTLDTCMILSGRVHLLRLQRTE